MTAPCELTTVDPAAFRQVLGNFASGVTVLSSLAADGTPVGMTCQSFFSVSLDPPMVAFSASKSSTTFPTIADSGKVCVNVLASDQHSVSDAFARSGADKWSGIVWAPTPALGLPAIEGALAWIECEMGQVVDGGDHVLALAKVVQLDCRSERGPLLYFRGDYARLGR